MSHDALTLNRGGKKISINQIGVDISIPIERGAPQRCFGLGSPSFSTWKDGGFTGSIALGGSCNVEEVKLIPHGHGTHTETAGHLADGGHPSISRLSVAPLMLGVLVSAKPVEKEGDKVLTSDLWTRFTDHNILLPECALIRTVPNDQTKLRQDYTGTNPPYLQPELARRLRVSGFRHLMVDLPSVDREDDSELLAHRAFFGLDPSDTSHGLTITELLFIPDTLPDGLYAVSLQTAPFGSDAAPSRVVLYPVEVS